MRQVLLDVSLTFKTTGLFDYVLNVVTDNLLLTISCSSLSCVPQDVNLFRVVSGAPLTEKWSSGLTQFDELRDGLLLPEGRVAALGEKHHQHVEERLHGEALGLVGVDRTLEEQGFEAPQPVDAILPAAPGVL